MPYYSTLGIIGQPPKSSTKVVLSRNHEINTNANTEENYVSKPITTPGPGVARQQLSKQTGTIHCQSPSTMHRRRRTLGTPVLSRSTKRPGMKFLRAVVAAMIRNREHQANAYRSGYRYYY